MFVLVKIIIQCQIGCFISTTKNACGIKRFKDQVNLLESLYRPVSDDSGLTYTIQ